MSAAFYATSCLLPFTAKQQRLTARQQRRVRSPAVVCATCREVEKRTCPRAAAAPLVAATTCVGAFLAPAAWASSELLALGVGGGDSILPALALAEAAAIFGVGALYVQAQQKLSAQDKGLSALLRVRRSLQRLQLDTVYAQTSISGGSKDEETSTEASLSKSAESTLKDAMLGRLNPDSVEVLTTLREAKRALANGNVAEAELLYSKALEGAKVADDGILMKRAYRGLGVACRDLERFDEAIDFLQKALEMSQVLDSVQGFSSGPSQRDIELCGMIADIQIEQGQFDEAQVMYKRYVDGLEILGESMRQAQSISAPQEKQAA